MKRSEDAVAEESSAPPPKRPKEDDAPSKASPDHAAAKAEEEETPRTDDNALVVVSADRPQLPAGVRAALADAWPASKPRAPPHLHGWFLDTHKRVFRALLTSETRTVLELGSWYGASTRWLAEACPRATVFAVDWWDDAFILDEQADHYETMGRRKLRAMLDRHPLWDTFRANLWDLRDRVVPLRMATVEGVDFLKRHAIVPDVVYIDADHHYDACKRDIEACVAAFPTAVLVGDDYGHYDDVRRAVTEVAQKHGKEVHVDQNHCWAFAHIDGITGRNFRPQPPASSSFASLLDDFKATK